MLNYGHTHWLRFTPHLKYSNISLNALLFFIKSLKQKILLHV